MNLPADLVLGDTLLYGTSDLVDEVIMVKTGGNVAHVEVYAGDDKAWASRNGIGVGLYDYRAMGLVAIRRNHGTFNKAAVDLWFPSVNGAPYGWDDIAESVNIKELQTGFHCSHFAALVQEIGGCPQFDKAFDKVKVTPRDFGLSLASFEVR